MPLSGPGRQSLLKKASIKKKKKETATPLPASPASLLIENRRPSILALEGSAAVEGGVPEDDVQAMTELADRVSAVLKYHSLSLCSLPSPSSSPLSLCCLISLK